MRNFNFTPARCANLPSNRWQHGITWGWVPRGQHINGSWTEAVGGGHWDLKDRKGHDPAPTFAPSMVNTESGYVMRATARNQRLYWQVINTGSTVWDYLWFSLASIPQFSLFVAMRPSEIPSDAPLTELALMGISSGTTGRWQLYMYGSTQIRFSFHTGATQTIEFTFPTFVANTYYAILLTRRPGGNYDCYVNGIPSSTGTITNSNTLITANNRDLTLCGTAGATASTGLPGDYYAAYIWKDRVLMASDCARLYSDPWAPARPQQWLAMPFFFTETVEEEEEVEPNDPGVPARALPCPPLCSLGGVVSEGLRCLKEPNIDHFSAGSILQCHLIKAANNAVREVLALRDFDWGIKHAVLSTVANLTTGTVSVTNGSAAISSTQDLTGYEGYWLRVEGDRTSYEITAINIANPTQATLATSYTGTTNSAASYRIFRDTYSVTTSDFDEVHLAGYGDGAVWAGGHYPEARIEVTDLSRLIGMAGGDLHQNTSGKPHFMARISNDSGENPRYVLWPFPIRAHVIDLWYKTKYTEHTLFTTPLFNDDAPPLACDAVRHAVCAAAYRWDNHDWKAQDEERMYRGAKLKLMRLQNPLGKDQGMGISSNRRDYDHATIGRPRSYFHR